VYDEDTVARIERGAAKSGDADPDGATRRRAAPVRRTGVGLAVAGAIALGLREVFDPPTRVEIEEVDPWAGGVTTANGVRFDWHPEPPQSVAHVAASHSSAATSADATGMT